MVECGLLRLRFGIDEDKLVAARDGFPVPEAMRVADPGGRPGDIEGETVVLLAKAVGALVVGDGDLRLNLEDREGEHQDRLELLTLAWHLLFSYQNGLCGLWGLDDRFCPCNDVSEVCFGPHALSCHSFRSSSVSAQPRTHRPNTNRVPRSEPRRRFRPTCAARSTRSNRAPAGFPN